MADRCTLHRNKFDAFKEWLISDGWSYSPGKGTYQVAQFRKKWKGKNRCLIVYDRQQGDHYTTLDKDYGVVRAFIRSLRQCKEKGTVNE